MQVTWWIPGMQATLSAILVRPRGLFRGRLGLGASPDLIRERLVHLFLEVGDKAHRPGHDGEAAGDPPGQLQLARDGGDRPRGVDWKLASIRRGRLLGDQLHELHVRPGVAVLHGQGKEPGRARVGGLVHRVAEARDDLLARPVTGHDLARDLPALAARGRLLEQARRLLDRSPETVAHAQQPRRHGRLQGLRGAEVGQPGGDRARGDPVLDQGDQDRVEHHRLAMVRQAALELEVRDIAERHLAYEVGRQVVAADEDLVGGAAPKRRPELAAHFLTVSRVLYPASPKSASGTSVTPPRNIRREWIASSISATRAESDACRSVTSTSTGTGGSIDVSWPVRTTRARPVTRGRNSPTTDRIAAG